MLSHLNTKIIQKNFRKSYLVNMQTVFIHPEENITFASRKVIRIFAHITERQIKAITSDIRIEKYHSCRQL